MLEARGVPPHLFGALGSSMRHILHRSMNTGAMGKVQSLIKGMQAKEDEGQQLTAVMEMCQVSASFCLYQAMTQERPSDSGLCI